MGSCRARSVYLTTCLQGRQSSKRFTSIVHILSPETDNCPSWISGRERMTVENISWSISMNECCRPRRGLNPRPPGLQSDGASNWATEAGGNVGRASPKEHSCKIILKSIHWFRSRCLLSIKLKDGRRTTDEDRSQKLPSAFGSGELMSMIFQSFQKHFR